MNNLLNKFNIWQNKICITYHNDNNYQIFETENGNFVFDKTADKVYQITLERFNKLLIDLAALIPPINYKNRQFKNDKS